MLTNSLSIVDESLSSELHRAVRRERDEPIDPNIERLHELRPKRPIKPENRVKLLSKNDAGDLLVTLNGGTQFLLPAEEETAQAWVVYSVLAKL